MKKKLCFLLALCVLMSMAACSSAAPAGTTAAPTETTEPEAFVTTTIIQNGASDFVIVHDGRSATIETAKALRNTIFDAFGIKLEVKIASADAEEEKEIIIGNCRPIVEKAMGKLTGTFDFIFRVEPNKLVLYANHSLGYDYLGQYLKEEVFVKGESADLTLDSDDNLLYSNSPLMEQNYIEYVTAKTGQADIAELCAWKEYRNTDTVLPYRIYVPFNYTPEKQYPLLVSLHGAGKRGNDNQHQMLYVENLLKTPELPAHNAIIIFPQCPTDQKWVDVDWDKGGYDLTQVPESNELKAVMELVAQVQQAYSIDSKRIYACGYSMGGFGTWNLLMNHPDVFCAGIAMCGAGDPNQAEVLKDIPIWAIHGALDPRVSVEGSREMAKALNAVEAADFHYTELPDNEHDVWTYTYSNLEIWNWLMSRTKE